MIGKAELRQRFLAVGTSNVADALDDLGRGDFGLSSQFTRFSGDRVAGFAYTIAGRMEPYEGSGDPKKMDACNGIDEHEVAVWAGDGAGVCYFGELIALGLQERGCVGAIVDGGVRDVSWLSHHGFTTFARYRSPIQSIGRWRVTAWQEPVKLPGATVDEVPIRPGDFLLADDDGAIVVPIELLDDALAGAERITATEVEIRRKLAEGNTLAACLEEFGHV